MTMPDMDARTYNNNNNNNALTTRNNPTLLETLKSTSVKRRHTSQTRIACYLTLATMALIAVTTLSVHTMNYITGSSPSEVRYLNEDEDDDQDYSAYICDDIFQYTETGSDERCEFAKVCNSNQGLQFSFIFCNAYGLSTNTWVLILSPFLTIWLIILFRMLGSTAEEFFSPSLEMFSIKMGLPPRFSGVTLLALGNGAADVSATMSAIVQNPEKGYEMSLGALTGAGMFVGTVVAGIVIVIADGVKCRGALVRDLLMFILTLAVVYSFFDGGKIGSTAINTFFWMYIAFVIVVLVADVYHRAVVLPRLRKYELEQSSMNLGARGSDEDEERNNGFEGVALSEGELSDGSGNSVGSSNKKVTFNDAEGAGDVELAETNKTQPVSPLTAPDTTYYDESKNNKSSALQPETSVAKINSIEHNSMSEFFTDSPNANNPTDNPSTSSNSTSEQTKKKGFFRKIFSRKKKKRVTEKVQSAVDTIMTGLSNYAPGEGNPNINKSFKGWSEGLEVTNDSADKPVKLHGTHGILNKKSSDEASPEEHLEEENNFREPSSSYRVLLENVDNLCTADGVASSGIDSSWGHSFSEGWEEMIQHFRNYVKDIFENEENNAFDKFFLVCELPFTFLRKLSVPIPCDDYYCRGLVAVSLALSPVWFGVYSLLEKHSNLFFTGGFPVIEITTLVFTLVAILIFKFAPAEGIDMSLVVSVPIAFIGFIIAATWIDAIADLLVRLLTLLGVICRIPGSIMGITILAWGNSMGDLSANMTMARKGLANMAITACFAGPVFNILIGLGGGFTQLNASTGAEYTEVSLSPSITIGFIFLLANCGLVLFGGLVWKRGIIPKEYGYIAVSLYIAYVALSVWSQFYNKGDDEDEN